MQFRLVDYQDNVGRRNKRLTQQIQDRTLAVAHFSGRVWSVTGADIDSVITKLQLSSGKKTLPNLLELLELRWHDGAKTARACCRVCCKSPVTLLRE